MTKENQIIMKALVNHLSKYHKIDREEAVSMVLSNPEYSAEYFTTIMATANIVMEILEVFD